MKVVLVRFKNNQRRDFELAGATTVIGRRTDCDLRIAAGDVSRRHCNITLKNNQVVVKDLGSSNGTFVNDKRVAEAPIKAGDRLRVGPVVFVVQVDGKPATIKPSDARRTPPKATPPTPAAAAAPAGEEVFDLSEADFDLDDAISSLDKLDEEKDMP